MTSLSLTPHGPLSTWLTLINVVVFIFFVGSQWSPDVALSITSVSLWIFITSAILILSSIITLCIVPMSLRVLSCASIRSILGSLFCIVFVEPCWCEKSHCHNLFSLIIVLFLIFCITFICIIFLWTCRLFFVLCFSDDNVDWQKCMSLLNFVGRNAST